MKRPGILHHLLWLVGFIVLLAGCATPSAQSTPATPAPPTQSTRTSRPVTQLKPDGPIPSFCPASPVNAGGKLGPDIPWIEAQPTSSNIVAHLAYSFVKNGMYRLAPKNGVFTAEGLYTKTMWSIDNLKASSELRIDGTNLADSRKTFHDTGNAISVVSGSPVSFPTTPTMRLYTSYIDAPSVGCWRLQITSGRASGSIVMWITE
jgi:hypothetical protein